MGLVCRVSVTESVQVIDNKCSNFDGFQKVSKIYQHSRNASDQVCDNSFGSHHINANTK